jgi:hypothetical protein
VARAICEALKLDCASTTLLTSNHCTKAVKNKCWTADKRDPWSIAKVTQKWIREDGALGAQTAKILDMIPQDKERMGQNSKGWLGGA